MNPIPCSHCGRNYMRPTLDPEAPKLCNGCSIREEKRNPKGNIMETIGILIQCPKQVQIEIEELCINQGIDFTRYFLELHYGSQSAIAAMKEHKEKGGDWDEEEEEKPDTKEAETVKKTLPKKGGKK